MQAKAGTRVRLPTEESLLEGRLDRDRAVHAAVEAGRPRGSVAREFGLTGDEVLGIHEAIESSGAMLARLGRRARNRAEAAEARAARAGDWPPARIRNLLVREFGIPESGLGDAALIEGTVTRSAIQSIPMSGTRIADAVDAFLVRHGLGLRP